MTICIAQVIHSSIFHYTTPSIPPLLTKESLGHHTTMSSSEKDLVHDSRPPVSSFGNHPTGTDTAPHDRPPTPEELAGPSQSPVPITCIITDRCRFIAERIVMARPIPGASGAYSDDPGGGDWYVTVFRLCRSILTIRKIRTERR